jgi:serine/threonine protein kinase
MVSRSSTSSSHSNSGIEKRDISDFTMGGLLGEGAYGRVVLGEEKKSGRSVAVKEINKEKI